MKSRIITIKQRIEIRNERKKNRWDKRKLAKPRKRARSKVDETRGGQNEENH